MITSNTDDDAASWDESDSKLYRRLIPIAVPHRVEQLATMLTLIPLGEPSTPKKVIEIGSGAGSLSGAILTAFDGAKVLAFDGSASQRSLARKRLAPFGERFEVCDFGLEARGWRKRLKGAHAVVSSLCLHHLNHEEKEGLFREVFDCLDPRGAFVIADLVEPRRPEAKELFQASWDRSARIAAERLGSAGSKRGGTLFDLFVREKWNVYRHPDPADRPSPLFLQLQWLEAAGFEGVDCHWLNAGHAIYGGYRSGPEAGSHSLGFEEALRIAAAAISARPPETIDSGPAE